MAGQGEDLRGDGGPHYQISNGWLIFPMHTADGRSWEICVEPDALEGLAGQRALDHDAIERVMLLHVFDLELAALRVIGKGMAEGDTAIVTAASLRL